MSKNIFTDLFMNSVSRIRDLLDPVLPQDAATKAYVDAQLGGSTDTCVDGGFANSVFTTEQCIDGGGA